jgi:phosphoribosylamine--glycine ligase
METKRWKMTIWSKRLQRVLLVGGGAREHAIGEALCRSGDVRLLVVSNNDNPGLAKLAQGDDFVKRDEKDVQFIVQLAKRKAVDFAVIGLEDPLEVGLPDKLAEIDVPVVGPSKQAAMLETSKLFLRDLMQRHNIPGQVTYRYFSDLRLLGEFLKKEQREFVLKPVGLTAGKGVKVMGVQLGSTNDAISYAEEVIRKKIGGVAGLIVEERVLGEEFTLQTFVDGKTILPMPLVKDFKRALEGDKGANTGSMGSYSQANGLLPFVTQIEYDQAVNILHRVVHALISEGVTYKGILYGQFMKTKDGSKLIEINARFGDPEAINVLPLLKNDFVEVCRSIISGSLNKLDLRFAHKATVCKYVTPPGYGDKPEAGVRLRLEMPKIESLGVKVYFAKLTEKNGELYTTTSRSAALLGIGDSVDEAESMVEQSLPYIHGKYHIRHDIGKAELVQSSCVKEMQSVAR